MSEEDLLPEEPNTSLDPYETLDVPNDATEAQIRSAYKKLALKHHPDKVAPSEREYAHKKFQEVAFAYAILSDPKRRNRYDTTGSTAESALDDEDFDWSDFFKARYQEITTERILEFEKQYKGGDEERQDVLKAYKKIGGRMTNLYELVMLSNPLTDEDRFQEMIKAAIDNDEVPPYDAFLKETATSRAARMKKAEKEAAEAQAHAEEMGLVGGDSKAKKRKLDGDVEVDGDASSDEDDADDDDVKSSKSRRTTAAAPKKAKKPATKSTGGLGDLAAMISQRQQSRATTFLDDLEAKYAPKSKGKKKKTMDEPPEEAFARNATRGSGSGSKS